jgi:hypothetical protein
MSPEQHSACWPQLPEQPTSPFGIQLTQVPVVVSQTYGEQQLLELEQGPPKSLQEGGEVVVVVVLVVVLVVVVVVGATQVPLEQMWPTSQHLPWQHSFEQQCSFFAQGWPTSLHLAKAIPILLSPRAPPSAAPRALRA